MSTHFSGIAFMAVIPGHTDFEFFTSVVGVSSPVRTRTTRTYRFTRFSTIETSIRFTVTR